MLAAGGSHSCDSDLQISASGKTTSLGDHETEADAARAFDRAAINKSGRLAKTNFPISDYEGEIDDLTGESLHSPASAEGRLDNTQSARKFYVTSPDSIKCQLHLWR